MAPRQKRKNPVTPSPRKRSARKAKQPRMQPDIILDGGQLQTVFPVEPPQTVASAMQPSRASVNIFPPAGPSNTTPGLHQGHQEDLLDPFIAPSQHLASPEVFQLSPISDRDEDEGETPRRVINSPMQPYATTPSHRQQRVQRQPSGPAGNRRRHVAEDTLTFFTISEGRKMCTFCLSIKEQDSTYHIHSYSSTTATGTLRRHLTTSHLEDWVSECETRGLSIKSEAGLEAVAAHHGVKSKPQVTPRPQFSSELFVDTIADFIISTDQPISIVEAKEFRTLLLLLKEDLEDCDIPGRTTITTRIQERHTEHLKSLSAQMQANSMGKISFTMDIWSDPDLKAYMAVTAHWMECQTLQTSQQRLSLRADLIGFINVVENHTGEHLAQVFLFILDRLKIANKIGWITVDNASNNNTCINELERSLQSRNIEFIGDERHIRCFPHIVNLACKSMLVSAAGLDPAQDPIKKLRDAIHHIRNSSIRRKNFSDILKLHSMQNLQLIRDVETRWSSTYLMINRALDLRPAIQHFLTEYNTDIQLTQYDWDTLASLQEILVIPHSYQQLLSAEKTPTIHGTVPAFEGLIKTLKEHQDENVSAFYTIQPGIEKLEDYHAETAYVPAYILAILLNPLEKLEWFEEYRPDEVSMVKKMLYEALHPYYIASRREPSQDQRTQATQATKAQKAQLKLGLRRTNQGQGSSLDDEIRSYFAIRVQDGIDIISFWQDNKEQFPTLFKLAMDILPIQASSVPCERVFSSSKETTTPRRNKLTTKLVEALQLLKYDRKHGTPLNFTTGLDKDEEVSELEAIEKAQPGNDLHSVISEFQNML